MENCHVQHIVYTQDGTQSPSIRDATIEPFGRVVHFNGKKIRLWLSKLIAVDCSTVPMTINLIEPYRVERIFFSVFIQHLNDMYL